MSDEERWTTVESLLMHLQHELEQMHQALLDQGEDLSRLRKEMMGLRGRMEQLAEPEEQRDLRLERPPHY